MKKLTLSKKFTEKFVYDLYFNSRKRNLLKKNFLGLQKEIIENTPTGKPISQKDYEEREDAVDFLSISVRGLKKVKEAEEFQKKIVLKKCKFKLYKSVPNNSFIIKADFFRVATGANDCKFLLFSHGFPLGHFKKRVQMAKRMNLKGYKLMDQGVFRQKIENFWEFSLSCRGKFFKEKLLFKHIKGSEENLWAKNGRYETGSLNREKRCKERETRGF